MGGFAQKLALAQKIRSDLGIARLWPEALPSRAFGEIGDSVPPVLGD
jgi:hypothetical protein